MGWCDDEEIYVKVKTVELNPDACVIGFQVVGEGENEGQIHPMMDGSFCVYSLKQAWEMFDMQDYGCRTN